MLIEPISKIIDDYESKNITPLQLACKINIYERELNYKRDHLIIDLERKYILDNMDQISSIFGSDHKFITNISEYLFTTEIVGIRELMSSIIKELFNEKVLFDPENIKEHHIWYQNMKTFIHEQMNVKDINEKINHIDSQYKELKKQFKISKRKLEINYEIRNKFDIIDKLEDDIIEKNYDLREEKYDTVENIFKRATEYILEKNKRLNPELSELDNFKDSISNSLFLID